MNIKKIKNTIEDCKKYAPLLRELVERDIKTRYRRSVLGIVWVVLNPLLMMGVMTFIFSHLFTNSIEHFHIYYLCGYLLYNFLNEATTGALYAIVYNASLLKKVYVPKYMLPFSKVASSCVNLFFSFIAMLVVMLFTGVPIRWTMLLAIVPVVYLLIFSTGLGLLLGTAHVFFRDVGYLYNVVLMLWMYATPIFYPKELLGERMPVLLELNPLFHYISYFRQLVLEGTVPGIGENLICFAVAFFMSSIGLLAFYKKQDKFILYI